MSDAVALDLLIQDFITTNKVMNSHESWPSLINRRFHDDCILKVFSFQSEGTTQYAVGRHIAFPDSDWFRIELTRAIPSVEEHRFDCLRMMHVGTHTGLAIELPNPKTVIVKLITKNPGLINVVFVIRDCPVVESPFLL